MNVSGRCFKSDHMMRSYLITDHYAGSVITNYEQETEQVAIAQYFQAGQSFKMYVAFAFKHTQT